MSLCNQKRIMGSMRHISLLQSISPYLGSAGQVCDRSVLAFFLFSSSRRDEGADIPRWPEGRVGEALRPLLLKYIEGKQEVGLLEG